MFDAHLHLRDSRILPYRQRFIAEALAAGVTSCIDCACRPEEWGNEVKCALNVTPAYGLHPWHVPMAQPDWLHRLEETLHHAPEALVGEFGLDGIRKTNDGGEAQRQALRAQFALAARLGRPVVLHGARAWTALFRELEPWIDRLPAVLLHGASFSPDLLSLPLFRCRNIWFGIGGGLLAPNAKTLPQLAKALPLDRLLIETDAPDMFPCGGEPLVLGQKHTLLNHPANLKFILNSLAALRKVAPQELESVTGQNACTFLERR